MCYKPITYQLLAFVIANNFSKLNIAYQLLVLCDRRSKPNYDRSNLLIADNFSELNNEADRF